jgi:hypothetical protein
MGQVEARGGTSEIYAVQLSPEIGATRSVTTYHKLVVEDFSTGQGSSSLLSSAPLTPRQIELGQQIARKHGLTE